MLTNQEVLEALLSNFGVDNFSDISEPYGLLTLTTDPDLIIPIVGWLKTHEKFQIGFLTTLCGIHFPDNEDKELGVVYHLHSLIHNFRIRLKIFFPIQNPIVPSMTGVHLCANWMERETYDFFGIIFEGHPNLTRILNMDDMDYFPLLKQYPLEDPTRRDKIDYMFGR